MLARSTAIILSLVMAFTIFPMSASAETGDGDSVAAADEIMMPDYAPGQLIVVTEQGTSKKQMNSIARRAAGRVDDMSTMSDGTKVALVDVEEGDELAAAEAFESGDRVLLAQPTTYTNWKKNFQTTRTTPAGNRITWRSLLKTEATQARSTQKVHGIRWQNWEQRASLWSPL